jgi:hypothetical protein
MAIRLILYVSESKTIKYNAVNRAQYALNRARRANSPTPLPSWSRRLGAPKTLYVLRCARWSKLGPQAIDTGAWGFVTQF